MGYNVRVLGADRVFAPSGLQRNPLDVAFGAGRVFTVMAYNQGAAGEVFLMIFDRASTPPPGTVPFVPPLKIPASETGAVEFTSGIPFRLGLWMAVSTTGAGYTLPGTETAQYLATWRAGA